MNIIMFLLYVVLGSINTYFGLTTGDGWNFLAAAAMFALALWSAWRVYVERT